MLAFLFKIPCPSELCSNQWNFFFSFFYEFIQGNDPVSDIIKTNKSQGQILCNIWKCSNPDYHHCFLFSTFRPINLCQNVFLTSLLGSARSSSPGISCNTRKENPLKLWNRTISGGAHRGACLYPMPHYGRRCCFSTLAKFWKGDIFTKLNFNSSFGERWDGYILNFPSHPSIRRSTECPLEWSIQLKLQLQL